MHLAVLSRRFSGPFFVFDCKQMAGIGVISKCKKTVKVCLQFFSTKKENYTYLCNCGIRCYSSKAKISGNKKFDVIVIGGGSAGLSCAREARVLGASVCVVDFVTPSPRGTTWGMGGTCVNVGCIPKKLMHEAALLRQAVDEAVAYGWELKDVNNIKFDWAKLKTAIQDQIKSINWTTRVAVRENKIEYINGFGKFVDSHTVEVKMKDEVKKIYGENIVVAIGGRPNYPKIPGAYEFGITSDDIFNLTNPPGKTLIVGAGYIALEFAGFLNTFKYPVTVMVRSIVLRNFDRQMADLLTEDLSERGVRFLNKTVPKEIKKEGDKFIVTFENLDTKEVKSEEFNCVVFAIGRKPSIKELNLKTVDIKVDEQTQKIITNDDESTNISHIYAIGDVSYGKPELSPSAIRAGLLLARRITGKSKELMNYFNIPTTIFTPLEYGCVGMTEDSAIKKFGEDNLEVYHSFYNPPEFFIPQKSAARCYLKVICERESCQKILGMHFIGTKAGEVIQGYAAGFQCDLNINHLQATVGIHPTVSEEFTRLVVTKRSGLDPTPQTCCS